MDDPHDRHTRHIHLSCPPETPKPPISTIWMLAKHPEQMLPWRTLRLAKGARSPDSPKDGPPGNSLRQCRSNSHLGRSHGSVGGGGPRRAMRGHGANAAWRLSIPPSGELDAVKSAACMPSAGWERRSPRCSGSWRPRIVSRTPATRGAPRYLELGKLVGREATSVAGPPASNGFAHAGRRSASDAGLACTFRMAGDALRGAGITAPCPDGYGSRPFGFRALAVSLFPHLLRPR